MNVAITNKVPIKRNRLLRICNNLILSNLPA